MQPSRNKLKIPVLIFFIFLISGFVAYRSGALDELFSRQKEPAIIDKSKTADSNSLYTINPFVVDTMPGIIRDTEFNATMSSSKSIIVTEDFFKPRYKSRDTLLENDKFQLPDSFLKKMIISSSKSGRIFEVDTLLFKPDTIKTKH